MEDQLAKTDVSGYKNGVDIIPFSEVVRNGASSDIRKFQNLLLFNIQMSYLFCLCTANLQAM